MLSRLMPPGIVWRPLVRLALPVFRHGEATWIGLGVQQESEKYMLFTEDRDSSVLVGTSFGSTPKRQPFLSL